MGVQTRFKNQVLNNAGEPVQVGMKAPNAILINNQLEEVQLEQYADHIRIISVVPSLDTGVCQAQTRRFNEEATSRPDVVVLTISMDLPFAQQRFCAAEGLERVHTLSDHRDADFGQKYGFLMPSVRLLSRGVVVIDKDNVIRHVEYVEETSQEVDFKAALQVVHELA